MYEIQKYSTKWALAEALIQPVFTPYIRPEKPLQSPLKASFLQQKTQSIRFMKTRFFFFAALAATTIFTGCNSRGTVAEEISDDGHLLNDDLIAVRTDGGKVSIKNATTGKVTIKDIKQDWTAPSRNDSLAVFCSENKRGYYNMYTGEIAIPAQYRRAWVFAEGLAAVQKNGNIGFINRKGDVVHRYNPCKEELVRP